MMAINIVVFALLWYASPGDAPGLGDLVDWGANVAPMTLTNQPWRLLTSAFLHAGWMHLLMNMYALFVIGLLIEAAFGSAQFGVIYLLSALAGSLFSAEWHASAGTDPDQIAQMMVVSVGASGAIMGLVGAAAALWIYQRIKEDASPAAVATVATVDVIDSGDAEGAPSGSGADIASPPTPALSPTQLRLLSMKVSGPALIQAVVLTFGQSLFTSHVDQTAHFGGLIVGLASGLFCCMLASRGGAARRVGLPLGLLCVGTAAIFAIARASSNDTLIEVRTGFEEAMATLHEKRIAEKKVKQVDAQIKADAAHRPPPVSEAEAAGHIVAIPSGLATMAVGASGRTIYIGNRDANALIVVDAASHSIVKTIQGTVIPQSDPRFAAPVSVVVSPDEHYAYAASMRPDGVQRIDLKTGTLAGDLATGKLPLKVTLSPDGSRLYVLNGVDNTVSVIDARNWVRLPHTLTVGAPLPDQPGRLAAMWLSEDGARLFVDRGDVNGYREFDTKTFQKIGDFDVNYVSVIPVGGDRVWLRKTFDPDAALWYDAASGKTLVRYPVCRGGIDSTDGVIGGTPDGKWLVSATGNELQLIKTATHETEGRYPTFAPRDVAFSPDGKTLFVLGSPYAGTSQLAIIDVAKSLPLDEKAFSRFLCQYGVKDADPTLNLDSDDD